MSKELSNLLSRMFISRPDVKAIQSSNGAWRPHTVDGRREGKKIPWSRADLVAHLNGEKTFGHYLLSSEDTVKFFAFDIDLRENISEDKPTGPWEGSWADDEGVVHPLNPRVDWQNRAHPARTYLKYELKIIATKLLARVSDYGIQGAVAYSGHKGLHVYGFTGVVPASVAREGAMLIMEDLGNFEASKGDNFFQVFNAEPGTPLRNLTIEVFPKQDSLDGKALGNLMRLPLGKNLQNPKDPTFFVEMTSPMSQITPRDPVLALSANPWKMPNEL